MKKRWMLSAAALLTACGVAVAGLVDSPAALLAGERPPRTPGVVAIQEDPGQSAGPETEEEGKKRPSPRQRLRSWLLALPLGVRLAALLPLWLLGWAVTAAGGGLAAALPPLAPGIVRAGLLAFGLLGGAALVREALFPGTSPRRWKASHFLLIGALLAALNLLLIVFWRDFPTLREAARAAAALAGLSGLAAAAARWERRRQKRPDGQPPSPEPAPQPLTFTAAGEAFTIPAHRLPR